MVYYCFSSPHPSPSNPFPPFFPMPFASLTKYLQALYMYLNVCKSALTPVSIEPWGLSGEGGGGCGGLEGTGGGARGSWRFVVGFLLLPGEVISYVKYLGGLLYIAFRRIISGGSVGDWPIIFLDFGPIRWSCINLPYMGEPIPQSEKVRILQ